MQTLKDYQRLADEADDPEEVAEQFIRERAAGLDFADAQNQLAEYLLGDEIEHFMSDPSDNHIVFALWAVLAHKC